MKYREALEWFNTLKSGTSSIEQITELVQKLKLDLSKIKFVHVGGTNGKGSTSMYLESMLMSAKYKVGVFNSPQLFDIKDQIRINKVMILPKQFAKLMTEIREISEIMELEPSFFDVKTALALKYFCDSKVDYAIIEVGLGGLRDSTNIINPVGEIITNVDLEHTHILGNTVEEIAEQKAGIIKEKTFVVTGVDNGGLKVIRKTCKEKKVELLKPEFEIVKINSKKQTFNLKKPFEIPELNIYFLGKHQIENAALAVTFAKKLGIEDKRIKRGLKNAVIRGRLQRIKDNALFIVDCAHNPHAFERLHESISLFKYKKLIMIFGVLSDKNVKRMIEIMEDKVDTFILTELESPRSLDPKEYEQYIAKEKIVCTNVKEAIKKARKISTEKDLVLISGSVVLVGQALKIMKL